MPAAAPDVETILAYEAQLEPAFVSVFAAVNAVPEFSDAKKVTPYTDVIFSEIKPTGHKWLAQDGLEYFDAWDAVASFRIVTVRGQNSAQQSPLAGKVRRIAQQSFLLFNETNLPFHAIGLLKESGLRRGVDEEQRLDWSELLFTFRFNARAEAWGNQ